MQIQCVHCGKQYSLRDENVGSQFACRSCGKLSPISAPKPEESAMVGPPLPAAPPASLRQASPAAPVSGLFETKCSHCGKSYKVRADAGSQFRCKQCGKFSPVAAAARQSPAPLFAPLPQSARPAPPAARPARAAPLAAKPAAQVAAKPAAPAAAKPAAPVARPAQARPAGLREEPFEAELVAEPVAASPLVSPKMLDLLNEATLPGAASPYGLAAPETKPLPRAASPPRAPKPRRVRKPRASFDGEKIGLVLGGVFFICVGIGLFALGVYDAQHGGRRPGRIFKWGAVAIITGIMMVIGRPLSNDD